MKGRIPMPLELKLLRGNRRRRPVNPDAPLIVVGEPPKPSGLTRLESECWNWLVEILMARRTLHVGMAGILRITCSYWWQFQKAREACKASSVYRTRSREGATVRKQKPEVAVMFQAMKGYNNCLEHLGLTPASAARAHALPAPTTKKERGLERYFDGPPEQPSA